MLVEAFAGYPVMRYVIGAGHADEDARHRRLVTFFVMMRVWRDEPLFAVREDGRAVAAAAVTLPGPRETPAFVDDRREELWAALGDSARRRYEGYGEAARRFLGIGPHHHLNMVGVRRSRHGRGLARPLLDAVHALADADPASGGVSLTTETAENVPLYEHFGYRVLGHSRIADDLESWVLFRRRAG